MLGENEKARWNRATCKHRAQRRFYDMKWHRFFAWAGFACMALCIWTGKKHL